MSPAFGVAVEIGESNDVVYNNYVNTPTTAWLLPLNLYSGYPDFFAGTEWNITPQPATNVHFASGFPTLPLTGSIIGGTTQGGNFWWDYGLIANPYNGADNPYGVLPYDENAITLVIEIYGPSYYYLSYIYGGGDYAPLVPTLGPAVTFVEHGLGPGHDVGRQRQRGRPRGRLRDDVKLRDAQRVRRAGPLRLVRGPAAHRVHLALDRNGPSPRPTTRSRSGSSFPLSPRATRS